LGRAPRDAILVSASFIYLGPEQFFETIQQFTEDRKQNRRVDIFVSGEAIVSKIGYTARSTNF